MNTALKDLIRNPTTAELDLVERYAGRRADPRRDRLFEAFAKTGLPGRRLEGWRWSDFKAAVQESAGHRQEAFADRLARRDVPELCVEAGNFRQPSTLPAGLKIRTQQDVLAVGGAEDIPLGALAAALAGADSIPSTVLVDVADTAPVHLHIVVRGRHAFQAVRIAFLLRPGAQFFVTESHLGGAHFTTTLLEFTLQKGARLNRTVYQRGSASEVHALTAMLEQDADSSSTQTILSKGAKLSRIETRLVHREKGSRATLNAAYLTGAGFHTDTTTHVRHGANACVTRQLTKGAVRNGGRGVFQGKFFVPRHAGQQTDASMQHNALLLEEGAEVFAKPELEILADDVQCAHGNTSGALDPNQMFYLRQRGIPAGEARALLTEAFIGEALAGAGAFEPVLRAETQAWLNDAT